VTVGAPIWGGGVRSFPYFIFIGVGTIFGILLWKVPRERYDTIFANIFGWLPVSLGMLSYIFWYWYATGYTIGGEFFSAAAGVLPILLLTAVVDVRRTKDLEGKQLVLPIAAVFLGELAALDALAFPNDPSDAGPAAFAAVASSLVAAVVALVLAVMANVATPANERKEGETSSHPGKVAETNASAIEQTEASRETIEETPPSR
jgi:hypothetical protein